MDSDKKENLNTQELEKVIKLLKQQDAKLSYVLEKVERLQAEIAENTLAKEELVYCLNQLNDVEFIQDTSEVELFESEINQTKKIYDIN